MEISISIKPTFDQLAKAIGGVEAAKFLQDEINKIAFKIERNAKQLTPVDTGRLKSSIHTAPFMPLGAKISTNTEYAVFVHEGTRYMRGRPFMKTGAELVGREIEGDITARIDAEFAKAFKSL